jgi:uncharacterized membrane protein (DUF2068 family)
MKTRKSKKRTTGTGGLHTVAIFEGAKGLLVLLTGFGLLSYIHKDIHDAAVQLVRHFHLNPASHYPRIFLDLTEHVHSAQLWAMAGAAMLYAAFRIAEAIGLWKQQRWAEWFGVLTGGLYIPVEIYEVTRGVTWPRVTVLLVNAVIILYLVLIMAHSKKK